jgi:hypothetical protein
MIGGKLTLHLLVALSGMIQGDPNDKRPLRDKFYLRQMAALEREIEAHRAELQRTMRQVWETRLTVFEDQLAQTRKTIREYETKAAPSKDDITLIKFFKSQEQVLQRRITRTEAELLELLTEPLRKR